ncbi:MAG: hypothetical protein A2020_16470 [Lentisphaerae bacterium GWF2_45_14]|nr:MAG: hypothetical protein A2020_16470 [Lentisphaerae bacterium GWF2_45_14]
MGQMKLIGPDEKWKSFQAEYTANFSREISAVERPLWEMFARSADFELLKQTMRHFVNGYLLEKEGNSKAAKPGLAEFKDYCGKLAKAQKRQSASSSSCEFCSGTGNAVAVMNCRGGERLAMKHKRHGVYAAENPQAFSVSCYCEAGQAKEGQAAPDYWRECLFRSWEEALEYVDKCKAEYKNERTN